MGSHQFISLMRKHKMYDVVLLKIYHTNALSSFYELIFGIFTSRTLEGDWKRSVIMFCFFKTLIF